MKLTTTVICKTVVEGFHSWPGHQKGKGFLANNHRHLFHVMVEMRVEHSDRDVEFIEAARDIKNLLTRKYGDPCEFGTMSCEDIATVLINTLNDDYTYAGRLVSCSVWEDAENGALVRVEY